MTDKYEYVVTQLEKRKGDLVHVAFESGVSRRTLTNIITKKFMPRFATLDVLHFYLKNTKKRKA